MRTHRPISSVFALALVVIFGYADADFTADCPTMCECKWQSGYKAAICSQRELNGVPDKLSSEIQNVDLSNNPLIAIPPRAFEKVGLNNLKKLNLRDCKLSYIDKDGFSGLSIIVELDISKNNIKTLHPSTFNEFKQLKHLTISENKLERIEDGLFNDLPYLKKIDLRNNYISILGTYSFRNLSTLKIILLDSNNLTHINIDTVNKLQSIASLVLHDNPWICDCKLRSFRNWVIDHNLDTRQTACAEPERLRNRLWNNLSSENFACGPQILEPFQGITIKANDNNITLSCKVDGDPTPEVSWVQNSKVLGYDSRKNDVAQRYVIKQTNTQAVSARWTNLTIIRVDYKDSGEYKCIAKNLAGVEQRTVSLDVRRTSVATTGNQDGETVSITPTWSIWRMVVVVVILLIILILFLLFYICCKQRYNNKLIFLDKHHTNEKPLIGGSVVPEIQRSICVSKNPLIKPPRRYDRLSSVTSDTTEMSEMSEMGRGSLKNDFFNAPIEYVNCYKDSNDQFLKHTRDISSVDSARVKGQTQLSLDLITNSAWGIRNSLASSSVSTASVNSPTLLKAHALSHSQSSIYSKNPRLYKSLPRHTSSHLPVTPMQGYLTLPRRQHISNLSSNSLALPMLMENVEPVNDNLGLRKTANGSSVLSLNTFGLEQQLSPTVQSKELIMSPDNYQELSPTLYTWAEEVKIEPSLYSNITYDKGTLPKENRNSTQLQLFPNTTESLEPRRNNHLEPSIVNIFIPIDDNNRKTSTLMDHNRLHDPIDTMERRRRIPPPPPPKPKKKIPADINEILIEDDGEDGTEI